MEEVLWHSATCLFSKSILVKIPRLPTMRVIGSQFISTSLRDLPVVPVRSTGAVVVIAIAPLASVGPGLISGGQLGPGMAPLRFLVQRGVGDGAECTNRLAVDADAGGGDLGSRRLVHEGHELVGEARHGAPYADAAHVGASADAGHPAALEHVAVHHRPPASQLDDALGRAVLGREISLFVIACPVTAIMDGAAEQPLRSPLVIQRDHGCEAG